MNIRDLSTFRPIITRFVFLFIFSMILFRWYSYVLPHQLKNPPLLKLGYDPIYILYDSYSLQDFLVTAPLFSLAFSILLIVFSLIPIIAPLKRTPIIIFTFLYFIYIVTFNINLTFTSAHTNCILLITLCFWPKSNKDFELLWEFARYYSCWVYSSAFIWKFINGGFFQDNFGVEVLKSQLIYFIYQSPESLSTNIYFFFLSNPILINIGTMFVYFLEGIFIFGFFSKKLDNYFIFIIIFIHAVIYFFVDTLFIEQYILTFTFISLKGWQLITSKVKSLTYLLSHKKDRHKCVA